MRKILASIFLISLAFIFYGCGGHGVDVVATTTTISTTTSSSTTTTLASVAAPTFALASGSYEAASLSVTIETTTASADVYYTLDGSNPSTSSTKYTGALTLESSSIVKAIAVKNGLQNSGVSTANYDIYWWSPVGGGVSGGLAFVLDMAMDQTGNLYVGGYYNNAGGQIVDNIAKWNVASQTWEALKNGTFIGTENSVNSVVIDNFNNVYIGGDFATAGGVTVNHVARWDGTSWSALNTGTAGDVYSLLLDNSTPQILYAGGLNLLQQCTDLYTSPFWSSLGKPISQVLALALDNSGYLYAGGNFSSMSGVGQTAFIARYKFSQSTWESIAQINNTVNSITVDNRNPPDIYCGGSFTILAPPAQTYANHLAYYQNGLEWAPLGVGTDYPVSKIVYDPKEDKIYVGGSFANSADQLIKLNFIGVFNRTSGTWKPLGTGTDGLVDAIALDGTGNVYIGGQFTTAGGVTVNGIARWGKK